MTASCFLTHPNQKVTVFKQIEAWCAWANRELRAHGSFLTLELRPTPNARWSVFACPADSDRYRLFEVGDLPFMNSTEWASAHHAIIEDLVTNCE